MPGFAIALLDLISGEVSDEGEICIDLSARPVGLMTGYRDDDERTAEAMRGGYYHTGDVAILDADGYITYVGRADDVFKASDYRISPFELESVLLDTQRWLKRPSCRPRTPCGWRCRRRTWCWPPGTPDRDSAAAIFAYAKEHLAPYKRIRRLEFADLPKTISGKIRRVQLRALETERHGPADDQPPGARRRYRAWCSSRRRAGRRRRARGPAEFWEDDFPDLKR